MKKVLKIVLIVLGVLVLLVALDTLQAKVFDNSPILKIKETVGEGNTIDKGLLVNHYKCDNGESKTVWKNAKYTCPLKANDEEDTTQTPENSELSCLENLLGGYIVALKTSLVEEPLSSIIEVPADIEDALLIRGKSVTEPDLDTGISVIIKTVDNEIISQLDEYFNQNYAGYKAFTTGDYQIYLYNGVLTEGEFNDLKTKATKCLTK